MSMKVVQMRVGALATFAYIVADQAQGVCALIDPAFETARILDAVSSMGLRVTHVINTHGHSDHTAGNAAVIRATHAMLCIHEKDLGKLHGIVTRAASRVLGGAGSPKPDVLLKDGDSITTGGIDLQVIHTPGHTPGGICLYAKGNLFTGDSLFVASVGRTDLPGGSIRQLIKAIKERLYRLDDSTIVWPGHDYGPTPSSTIGREKAANPFTL